MTTFTKTFARILAIAMPLLLAACSRQTVKPLPSPVPVPAPPSSDVKNVPDAVPKPEPRSKYGNPAFYEVSGQRYFVLASSSGYLERGVASWYGKDFHGGRTATGEKYDMHTMTAAHKTLPLPCYAKVTNLRNGRSVVVRINDRGPFVGNRLIDLSFAAATRLDMVRDGTALVEIQVVEAAVDTDIAAPAPALYIQAGAFGEQTNAERLMERLRNAQVGTVFLRSEQVNGRTVHRVRLGPVPSVQEYDRVILKLKDLGIADARLAFD